LSPQKCHEIEPSLVHHTAAEAARWIDSTPDAPRRSIYRLFEAGELAWVQIGASRRVTSAEIHRFIAAHTEATS
jgi:hypothetical protein